LTWTVLFIPPASSGSALNGNIWSKVKQRAATVSGVGLKVLAALAESELKKHFGLM